MWVGISMFAYHRVHTAKLLTVHTTSNGCCPTQWQHLGPHVCWHDAINVHFRNLNWRYLPYIYKAYIRPMWGDIPTKYGLIWYSTSILGSWNSRWCKHHITSRWLKWLNRSSGITNIAPLILALVWCYTTWATCSCSESPVICMFTSCICHVLLPSYPLFRWLWPITCGFNYP